MDAKRTKQMEKHITILAWIHILLSGLGILGAMLLFGLMIIGGLFSGSGEDFVLISIMAIFASSFMLVLSVPGFIAGYGLLNRKSWARGLTVLLGLLHLINFPFGTAVGIYTFYVLFQKDAGDYFYQVQLAP